MQRQSVTSSNIKSIGYDPPSAVLEVEFTDGSIYRYYGVPAQLYASLMAASSHGSYLAREIKGSFRFEKV